MTTQPIAYILKMYPRFSETFILNEILELERQRVPIQIFSLKKPDDGRFHADLSRVRAGVTYVPESLLLEPRAFWEAHREVWGWNPRRYMRVLWSVIKRRRLGALKRFLQAGYLAPRLRRAGITHAHAHFASSATSVALYLHRLVDISYSFTAHAKDIYSDSVSADVLKRKLARARFAVTVSDYNQRYLSDIDGATSLHRIYNGLDLRQFAPRAVSLDHPPLILGVGRLVEKKGFAYLVEACAVLRQRGLQFRCRIVGKGPLDGELRALIRELKLEECVELAGPLPREALLELYPRASVFVAPCIVGSDGNRDGLPTVLIEAMAMQVPVISTDVTGIPELVLHERTGLIAPQSDAMALAGAIERVLTNPAGAQAMARAGRELVTQRFDLRSNVAQLRHLFEAASAT